MHLFIYLWIYYIIYSHFILFLLFAHHFHLLLLSIYESVPFHKHSVMQIAQNRLYLFCDPLTPPSQSSVNFSSLLLLFVLVVSLFLSAHSDSPSITGVTYPLQIFFFVPTFITHLSRYSPFCLSRVSLHRCPWTQSRSNFFFGRSSVPFAPLSCIPFSLFNSFCFCLRLFTFNFVIFNRRRNHHVPFLSVAIYLVRTLSDKEKVQKDSI